LTGDDMGMLAEYRQESEETLNCPRDHQYG
jgi:hypothetical protein